MNHMYSFVFCFFPSTLCIVVVYYLELHYVKIPSIIYSNYVSSMGGIINNATMNILVKCAEVHVCAYQKDKSSPYSIISPLLHCPTF